MKLKQYKAHYKWYKLHAKKLYSIDNFNIGISVCNFESAYKAKKAYYNEIKNLIRYLENIRSKK